MKVLKKIFCEHIFDNRNKTPVRERYGSFQSYS